MKRGPLKAELHHWWPTTLAKHWSDSDGLVSAIRPTGEVLRAPPKNFGAIKDAHHIKMGSPWDSTFEPSFSQPDAEISDFVRWLFELDAPNIETFRPMLERIMPQTFPDMRRRQMAQVVASLLARSPKVRHSIKLSVEACWGDSGLPNPDMGKNLIAINQQHLFGSYKKYMEQRGRWAVLISDVREFITGDGFFHNFPTSVGNHRSGLKLILPILPTVAIVYMLPMSYPIEPRLVSLRVGKDEVTQLNELVQIYAQDFLFFRTQKPDLVEAFEIARYQELENGGTGWLASVLDDLSQYCCWGAAGEATMTGKRPYLENFEGNCWLQSFTSS